MILNSSQQYWFSLYAEARAELIFRLRHEGLFYREIAQRLEISIERARQIVYRHYGQVNEYKRVQLRPKRSLR